MKKLFIHLGGTTATRFFYLVLAVVVACVTAFKFASLPRTTLTLPIEVYASDGFSATTPSDGDETVTINIPDVASVDSLGFKMHQPHWHVGGTYLNETEGFISEGAAAVSVNDGPFVDIVNDVVDCAYPESEMGPGSDECIGTVNATVRFSVPKTFSGGLRSGDNTLTFRFNGTKGIRSGYRVIGIAAIGGGKSIQDYDIWDNGGLLAEGTTSLAYDNPEQWGGPEGASESNGARLFTARNILSDHIGQPSPSMPGEPIVASCADCHAKDGSDLWYFNYSNETIIARSRFHGLTQEQGEDIAAYIRSIQLTTTEGQSYDAPGRPWNPPFQPGPTYGRENEVNAWDELTDDESHYWSAGAGLDDFLNTSLEELRYLWPSGGDPGNGIPPSGIAEYSDASQGGAPALAWKKWSMRGETDLKKYPIQFQFPDWNMWLPDVSPVGDMESCDVRTWDGGAYYSTYQDLVGNPQSTNWAGSVLASRNHSNPTQRRYTLGLFSKLGRQAVQFTRDCVRKHASTTRNMHEDQGWQGYHMIRIWEAYQYFDLYDWADEYVDHYSTNDAQDQAIHDWSLDIGMNTGTRHFFNAGPHILGNVIPDGNKPLLYGSGLGQIWATHAWYQIQVTLDPGISPDAGRGSPVDWQYQDSWMAAWGDGSGLDITPRQFVSESRRWQEAYDADIGVMPPSGADLESNPWQARVQWSKQAQLHRISGMAARATGRLGNSWSKYAKGYRLPDAMLKNMVTAGYRAWWDGVKTLPIQDFQQRQQSQLKNGLYWHPSSYVPSASKDLSIKQWVPDLFYQGLHRAVGAGAAPGVIDSIATQWSSPMWPQANESNYQRNGLPYAWEQIASYTPPPSDDGGGGGSGDGGGDDGGSGGGGGGDGGSPPADVGTYAKAADGSWISGGDVVASGVEITLGCNVTATDGDPLTVEFFDNDRSLATVDSSPFEHTYTPSVGAHDVYCAARDADGVTQDDGFGYVVNEENSGDPATQALHLDKGWNLVSSRIAPDTPALDDLFAGVSDLSVVVDEEGDVFLPDEGTNDIGHWTPNEGYLVFMTAPETVTLEGQPLDAQSAIPLEKGWNLVTYLPTASLPVAEGFASIQDELVMVKDVAGNAYLPDYDIDDIGSLIPGQGYRIFVSSATELIYPQPAKSASRTTAPAASPSDASQ